MFAWRKVRPAGALRSYCKNIYKSKKTPSERMERDMVFADKDRKNLFKVIVVLLPFFSFLGQYIFSLRIGKDSIFFTNWTVSIVDWIFIPFNYFVANIIDWKRGRTLFGIFIASLIINICAHAFWQYNGTDPGHIISNQQVILPAGWIHLGYAILQTALLLSFVLCSTVDRIYYPATICATIYFIGLGICGYIIHGYFFVTDVIGYVTGLTLVWLYPGFKRKLKRMKNRSTERDR